MVDEDVFTEALNSLINSSIIDTLTKLIDDLYDGIFGVKSNISSLMNELLRMLENVTQVDAYIYERFINEVVRQHMDKKVYMFSGEIEPFEIKYTDKGEIKEMLVKSMHDFYVFCCGTKEK